MPVVYRSQGGETRAAASLAKVPRQHQVLPQAIVPNYSPDIMDAVLLGPGPQQGQGWPEQGQR